MLPSRSRWKSSGLQESLAAVTAVPCLTQSPMTARVVGDISTITFSRTRRHWMHRGAKSSRIEHLLQNGLVGATTEQCWVQQFVLGQFPGGEETCWFRWRWCLNRVLGEVHRLTTAE